MDRDKENKMSKFKNVPKLFGYPEEGFPKKTIDEIRMQNKRRDDEKRRKESLEAAKKNLDGRKK